jgi:large repetitive protein
MEYQGFGSGSDGILTISSNTTEAPIDSGAVGSASSTSLSATNASFAANQLIMIHQSRGSGVGNWELTFVGSYSAGTITTAFPLVNTYNSTGANKAQVRVVPQYSNVTVNSGITYSAKAWNGSTGGIMAFLVSGNLNVPGSISSTGKGFVGGDQRQDYAYTGEGTLGASYLVSANYQTNGNGGSGGHHDSPPDNVAVSGAGGGNATLGGNGSYGTLVPGGSTSGQSDLLNMTFGGGGGGGSKGNGNGGIAGIGGNGGGIIFIMARTITITGSILSNGSSGTINDDAFGAGGSGAGGSILLRAQEASIGTNLVQANGGAQTGQGGLGGQGRVRIESCNLTGSTNQGSISYATGGHDFCQTFIHIYGT